MAGLTQAGSQTVLLETRQVKAALWAMMARTGRKDGRWAAPPLTAQPPRMGWHSPGAL